MRTVTLPFPEIALIAGTRGMMGVGIGLLLSSRLAESTRRSIGLGLFLIGALSTIPLARDVFGKARQIPA